MINKQGRRFEEEKKLSVLKRHLQRQEAVSDICEEIGIAPNQFRKLFTRR